MQCKPALRVALALIFTQMFMFDTPDFYFAKRLHKRHSGGFYREFGTKKNAFWKNSDAIGDLKMKRHDTRLKKLDDIKRRNLIG